MRAVKILGLLIISVFSFSLHAAPCAPELAAATWPLAELRRVAIEDCTESWSSTLRLSGTPATIKFVTQLRLSATILNSLRDGLTEADDALGKLREDGRVPSIGRSLHIIVTGRNELDGTIAVASALDVGEPCYITITPAAYSTAEELASLKITIAHEVFHCVQYASLPPGLNSAVNGWWEESSAEWFGILAQPSYERTENALSYELGANDYSHQTFRQAAWPLFAWYSEMNGAPKVLSFLRNLPPRSHTPEDIAGFFTHAEWADFAKRFSAYTLWMSDLGRINPAGRGERYAHEISASGAFEASSEVAQLTRENLIFDPGQWILTPVPSESVAPLFLSTTQFDGDPTGDWIPLDGPVEIKTRCGHSRTYVIVGYGADIRGIAHEFNVERVADDCDAACDALPTVLDECVIGMWADENTQPALEGLYEELAMEAPVYSFFPDGTYTFDNPFRGIVRSRSRVLTTHYTLNQSSGSWGSSSNSLTTCDEHTRERGSYISAGLMRTVVSLDKDEAILPARQVEFTFECSADTLILNAPRLGIRNGELTRMAGAADFLTP